MEKNMLKIYAKDQFYSYQTSFVHIFGESIAKKIKSHEIYNIGPSKIIFETKDKITSLVFMNAIISSDANNNVKILTNNAIEKIMRRKDYFTSEELEHARNIFAIYQAKGIKNLSVKEINEYNWAKAIVGVHEVINILVPYHIGGEL